MCELWKISQLNNDKHVHKRRLPLHKFFSADIIYLPQVEAELPEEDIKKMNRLIDMLEDNDDVQEVHHNWSI
ncbi:YebC/PmpR family DNA-binding transcriptional regulator [Alkaliphilus metalliredigens]|uniref:YebC/PmpR family DNA-binding transcriptional regulator n=1 Tax=Alkaliphilus metalliredigens TaxID=208226 RepID=UPI00005CBE90|nr:YebC/PmpR family DNA-binding transcriptional regulator [Alkaliphilus metalliredigens]